MSEVYIAIPLPPFHRWRLLASAADCPGGFAIVACVPSTSVGGRATLRSELSELLAAFALLASPERAHLAAYARQLLNEAAA